MYFCSANAQNVANIPPDSITGEFSLLVEYSGAYGNGCKQTFTEHNPGITYIRRMSDISAGHWSAWEPIATATPPQVFDLPLADGITALQPCTYYKNQFGEVTLGGCASGSVSDGATIATLPEGFRPDHPIERPATFTASGNRYAGSVFIAANGIVSIHTPAEATNVVFAASFLAKN